MILLLVILVLLVIAFAMDRWPIDLVALVSLCALLAGDLVSPQEAIAGFSNPAVITVMMMFIVSEGLVKSGLVDLLANWIAGLAGRSSGMASMSLLTLAGTLSAFINNTASVAIFMPGAIHLAKQYRFSPSKLLLPLSYACIFGGTCTLIGTSTNLLVHAMAEQLPPEVGAHGFGVFDFAIFGVPLFFLGMAYVFFFGHRLLPSRSVSTSLTRSYDMSAFLTEVKVPSSSRLVGKTPLEEQLSERFRLNVLEIRRGGEHISQNLRHTPMLADDTLIIRGATQDIVSFRQQYGLLLLTDIKLRDSNLADENNILAEVQLSPMSALENQSLKEIDFRRRYGCFVLAVKKPGETIRDKVAMIPLRRWDTLLVYGPRVRIEALQQMEDFVSLEEQNIRLSLSRTWWISPAIVLAVVALASFGLTSILEASIYGAVAMIATGRLRIQEAYRAVNWTVIFLIAAVLPFGTAMENTGLAEVIGNGLAASGQALGPFFVLSLIYLATSLLTEIMSNNSTVVLMVPVAASVAMGLGVDVTPFLFAVAFGGSSSFLTPMGYNTNAMVLAPGGYSFRDYVRLGWPLKVIFWIVSTLMIPIIWPF
ncbi:MAG: SLC13 family permease [Acidobacteriota bacterium]